MGWRELRAWIASMNRDRQPPKSDVGTWAGAEHDPGWAALRASRDRLRGR